MISLGHGFYRVTDRQAGELARRVGKRLPRAGYELSVVLSNGASAWLQRTPLTYGGPARGWVWAVHLADPRQAPTVPNPRRRRNVGEQWVLVRRVGKRWQYVTDAHTPEQLAPRAATLTRAGSTVAIWSYRDFVRRQTRPGIAHANPRRRRNASPAHSVALGGNWFLVTLTDGGRELWQRTRWGVGPVAEYLDRESGSREGWYRRGGMRDVDVRSAARAAARVDRSLRAVVVSANPRRRRNAPKRPKAAPPPGQAALFAEAVEADPRQLLLVPTERERQRLALEAWEHRKQLAIPGSGRNPRRRPNGHKARCACVVCRVLA